MKHKTNFFKLAVFATALLLPVSLFAQTAVLDDFEDGDNGNEFGGYWYFYADAENDGTSEVLTAEESGSELQFVPDEDYSPGYDGSEYAAALEFDLDDREFLDEDEVVPPFVALGTDLHESSEDAKDLTGATKMSFYAKADAPLTVNVKMLFAHMPANEYDVFQAISGSSSGVEVGTSWEQYEVYFTDAPTGAYAFEQEGWGEEYELDLTQTDKLAFEVKYAGDNANTGKLWIDDIAFHGLYVPRHGECMDCAGAAGQSVGAVLSDFEGNMPTKNAAGYYWYSYDDEDGRVSSDPSTFTAGVDGDDLLIEDLGEGYDGTDGISVGFTLSTAFDNDGNTQDPYVGVGTGLAPDGGLISYDADSDEATGIYFDYKTSADVNYVTIEMEDYRTPDRPSGAVHFVVLQGTDGEWAGATIPFSAFVLPGWAENEISTFQLKRLQTGELTKLQFKVSNETPIEGTLAIDNVQFIDAAQITPPSSVINNVKLARSGINVNQMNGALSVSLAPKAKDVSISIVSPQGRLVAEKTIKAGASSATLPVSGLANGVYMLKITGLNKTFTSQLPIVQ